VSSRWYAMLVLFWLVAAVVAVASALSRATPGGGDSVALPLSVPGVGVPASLETDDTVPSALRGVSVEPVRGHWTGPGGEPFFVALRTAEGGAYRSRQIGRRVFDLALRSEGSQLTQAPCSSCHQGQEIVQRPTRDDAESVHQNIRPVHPDETGAQCGTCHWAEDVGRLGLGNGDSAPVDHAYQLCAQCHFDQVESWAYGAHGKRLVGWRGQRVVMTCADCHDPHRPATVPRIPMAGVHLPGEFRAGSEGAEPAHD